MKLIPVIALFAFASCNNAEKKEIISMPGVYTMLSQSVDDGTKDTTYTKLKQLKIYTEDYMMYAHINAPDSVSGFGIGSYKMNSDTLIESVIYNASDTADNSSPGNFTLIIEKTNKGYKQIIPEIKMGGKNYKLSEEYETSGSAVKSPLDGAWKEIKSFTIKGKDTVNQKALQYKIYYGGHFIFGHTYKDSANKLHTGIGYGSFEMNGTNKVRENVQASTYYQIRGKNFDIDIEVKGADEFQQTITETNGVKNVEVYQRLKK